MDSTIETLEIIIKAKIDDALKGIKTVTDEVKNAVKQSVEPMKEISTQAKTAANNAASSINQIKSSTNSYQTVANSTVKQQEYLIAKIQELKHLLEEVDKGNVDLSVEGIDVLKVEADVERLEARLNKLQNAEVNPKVNTKDIDEIPSRLQVIAGDLKHIAGSISSSFGRGLKNAGNSIKNLVSRTKTLKNSFSKTFSDGVKSLKKFTLSLLSIRTAFTAISRAAQAYLSFDSQLSDSIQNSWNMLGSLLAPILEYVASLFSKVTNAIAQMVKALTGIDLVARANAKALKTQASAAKEATGQLASIDDINSLSTNKSGGGGSETPSISTEEVDITVFDNILKRVREIIDAWKNGDWALVGKLISSAFTDAFNFLSDKIKSVDWSGIGKNISDFLTNINWSSILVALVDVFGEAVLAFQDIFLAIDWAKLLGNLSKGLVDAFNEITKYLEQIKWSEIGQKLSDAFISIDWAGLGNSIINMMWTGILGIVDLVLGIDWSSVGQKISDTVHEWIQNIIQKFTEVDWADLGKRIADAIMDFITSVDWGQLGIDIINGLVTGLMSVIQLVVGFFQELFNRILEFFGIHSPSTLFAEMGTNIIEGLINGISALKDSVIKIFSDIWEGIKSVFSSVATFFKDIFTKAWTNVKNVFSTGGKIFDGIKDGIVNAFKKIVNKIIDGINKVVKIPFDGINSALKKIKSIDIFGLKPFDWISTIKVPQLPKLETGNVAYDKTIAIFGEYANAKTNPEITAPQSIIRDTLRQALDEYSFNNNRSERLTVQVGARTLFDDFIDYVNEKIDRGVKVFKEA